MFTDGTRSFASTFLVAHAYVASAIVSTLSLGTLTLPWSRHGSASSRHAVFPSALKSIDSCGVSYAMATENASSPDVTRHSEFLPGSRARTPFQMTATDASNPPAGSD